MNEEGTSQEGTFSSLAVTLRLFHPGLLESAATGGSEDPVGLRLAQHFENRAAAWGWEWIFLGSHPVLSLLAKSRPSVCPGSEASLAFSPGPGGPETLGLSGRSPCPTTATQNPWALGSSQGNP